uniref:Peptide-methionine (R)-S-oxide reductase n=1 Tax=Euplotes nobilii TaxID=184062 RepID=A0A1Q1NIA7_EUPNO|nr:methionine sulfoxide reductase B [Euplotes nobilii]
MLSTIRRIRQKLSTTTITRSAAITHPKSHLKNLQNESEQPSASYKPYFMSSLSAMYQFNILAFFLLSISLSKQVTAAETSHDPRFHKWRSQSPASYIYLFAHESDADLQSRLTPLQYEVTQNHGTEPPFKNEYNGNKDKGDYKCVVCGALLFHSSHKYDSGSGWPSFYEADDEIKEVVDESHGMSRKEVQCNSCGAHLGHVFPDGPMPTGKRYCMNSASMLFVKDAEEA